MDGSHDGRPAEPVTGRRVEAEKLAGEVLGRSARIARASIMPLGAYGRVALAAGLTLWVVGPAPWWESAPSTGFSLIALTVLVLPGVRLLRHRSRMQQVLDDLPSLLGTATRDFEQITGRVGSLGARWREAGQEAKGGMVAIGRRCWSFYRADIAPLREQGKSVGQVADLVAAFSAPAIVLSGVALVAALILILLVPLAILVRLLLVIS